MDYLQGLKPIYLFFLYAFTRAYFFRRRNGAPISARGTLFFITFLLAFTLRTVFHFSLWFVIIPSIIMLIYSVKGNYDVRRGKLNPDNKGINYNKFYIETFIVFFLSFLIIKLLRKDYFFEGF